ncbi:MAG: response regulator transcription factor [Candidatus Eisenbacteria bacterium]|uniref:Response regulator transcription factor n=1 Tax=Eiseniibacteriota bacterium TaxID=2212470 RepID=A0A538UAX2_UNCEI|nr:MAG: response regulator transcription factor [Candidatus Eisenbacteria bacterium]
MKQRVLVVEDDRRIADMVIKNLETAGYECHVATDGGQALADFERVRPDLVLLDLGLPGIDGLQVTRRLRRDSDVAILMLTARTTESDKLLGLELGADDYVTKPFSTAELMARVRALLRRASGTVRERVIDLGPLHIFSREALMEQVWGTDRVVDDRSIDSLVSRLRRKLEEDPARPRFIQTVWGAGYRFAEPV